LKKIDRRNFLKAAGTGGIGAAAATAIASPALAEGMPELKWRLTSSFPKALDTIYGAAEVFAKIVAEATDNKFQIQVFPAGEITPAFKAADAVTDGTVEMAHTASYYYVGKDPTFAFGTAMPFGLNARMQNAWMFEGGGIGVMNEFYGKFNIHGIPMGNTGCQMGGWFRNEIKSVADLKGLKMRIGGYAGQVMAKLGVIAQQIPGAEIYSALEKGTIDAAEWVGPYDDEKLGFYKVAKNYYYPGWWEGGAMLHLFVGTAKWESLPAAYKAIVVSAAHQANSIMVARYDQRNPAALRSLLKNGATLKGFPADVMDAAHKASDELYAETNAKNAAFKKVFDNWAPFRAESYFWWQVAELGFDIHQVKALGKK
jgi:TRAP-type mannitol/chloroaromatic compound transport system substrate-binding protein